MIGSILTRKRCSMISNWKLEKTLDHFEIYTYRSLMASTIERLDNVIKKDRNRIPSDYRTQILFNMYDYYKSL